MKVTIITINLNNELGLEKTIASVVNQTFQDFEHIIIDGGSTDGSLEIIKKYQRKNHSWISEPDTGIYNAMNKGIKKANGEYILFLNSGDLLFNKHTLTDAEVHLGSNDIVYGNLRYDRGGKFVDASYPDKLSFSYLYKNYLPHPSSFIKRKLLLENGMYEEEYKICADWAFFMKSICLTGASYLHIDQVVSIYDTQGLSAQPEHQSTIKQERKKLIISDFLIYMDDYDNFFSIKYNIKLMENKRLFRVLKFFGLYKSLLN